MLRNHLLPWHRKHLVRVRLPSSPTSGVLPSPKHEMHGCNDAEVTTSWPPNAT